MRKLIIILISLTAFSASAQRTWDQPVQIKSCTISIEANLFVATTVVELEFYNPNNSVVEGFKGFRLDSTQAITGFELELNGKYRKGSIEERAKATQAYNAIVGKRIDPALLSMDNHHNYSLRIFPFEPNGTRKVRFTIQQLMKPEKDQMVYIFPLSFNETIPTFITRIHASSISLAPKAPGGIITDAFFHFSGSDANLWFERTNIMANLPIWFALPINSDPATCFGVKDSVTHFAMKYFSEKQSNYAVAPGNVTVFWDVSASGKTRQIEKEINFLRQYIALHKPEKVTVIPFNYKIKGQVSFAKNDRGWINYIRNLNYDGGTQLGCIDLSAIQSGVVLIFSDGINSYGNATPKRGKQYVYTVHATEKVNTPLLLGISGNTGGSDIDLLKTSITEAIRSAGVAKKFLIDYYSNSGETIIDSVSSSDFGVFLYGTTTTQSDTIYLVYGNDNEKGRIEPVVINQQNACFNNAIARVRTLAEFPSRVRLYDYRSDFGLREKIVMWNTSYIVLERIEDYVRYNIEPPEEIMEECIQAGYVKKQPVKFNNEVDMNAVAADFKSKDRFDRERGQGAATQQGFISYDAIGSKPVAMDEVVVTSLGIKKKRSEVGYSTATVNDKELSESHSFNLADALSGRVSGLTINHTSADVQKIPAIRLRGMRSLTGQNAPLIVVNGVPVQSTIINSLNPNDVQSVTVLKGGQASTLFGSEGVNGAILIELKKGKSQSYYTYRQYKLSAMEDVDYLIAIKEASVINKKLRYEELRKVHDDDAGFYIDMADHFYQSKLYNDAFEILTNAAEKSGGDFNVMNAVAFTLEKWNWFDSSNVMLSGKSQLPAMIAKRAIAWNLYKQGKVADAVNEMYAAITAAANNSYQNVSAASFLLRELNAMIHASDRPLDVSFLQKDLIVPPVSELRITLELSNGQQAQLYVTEPGEINVQASNVSKNGGTIRHEYMPHYSIAEYTIPKPVKGRYKIGLDYQGLYAKNLMGKITIYKNYGRKNQTIHTETFMLDNQYGKIEIATLKL